IELKSAPEEDADISVVREGELTEDEKLKRLMDESKSRLNDQLSKFKDEAGQTSRAQETSNVENPMAGKYTIQLGSYATIEAAIRFAEGFTVRGYCRILSEVVMPGKGRWYIASLGLFDTVEEAKTYIRQEHSPFSGQDHVISEIK